MRITLIHNPEAGLGNPSRAELMSWLGDAGFDADYHTTQAVDFARLLADTGDIVAVAGGDGTVADVVRRFAGSNTPVAIIPLGTSNNIATSLGIGGPARQLIAGLPRARRRSLDVAIAVAPWGTSRFVESAGIGLFANVLHDAEREEALSGHDAAARDLSGGRGKRMRRMLAREPAVHREVEGDGEDLSGEYVLVAVLNIPFIGPRLALAPGADPDDGRLDLLLVRDDDRAAVDAYLAALGGDHDEPFPLPTLRCRHVRMRWDMRAGHLDDAVWPDSAVSAKSERGWVQLSVGKESVTVLVNPSSL